MAEAEASNAVATHDQHASGSERCAKNDLATWAFYFGLTDNSLTQLAEAGFNSLQHVSFLDNETVNELGLEPKAQNVILKAGIKYLENSMTDIQITIKSGAQVLIPTVNYSTDSTSSAANKSAGEGNGSGLEAVPSVAGQDHNPGQESTSQVAGIESSELGRPLNHEYGIGREGTMGLPGTLLSNTPNSGISVGGEILGKGNQYVGHSRPVASMVGLSQPNAPKGGLSAELEFSPSFYLSMRRKALCIISFIPCRKGDFPEDDDVFATSADQDGGQTQGRV